MKKRLCAIALAFALLFSLSAPVAAREGRPPPPGRPRVTTATLQDYTTYVETTRDATNYGEVSAD